MRRKLFKELRRRAYNWLGARGVAHEVREDIIQEAFIRVLRGWEKKGKDDDFARRVWKNAVSQSLIDYRRKRSGWLELSETLTDGSWSKRQTEELAQDAIKVMTVKQYMALVALRENDFNQGRAAVELGISESSLCTLLQRMRRRVTRELGLGEKVPSKATTHNVYREKHYNFNMDYPTVAVWFVEDHVEGEGWHDAREDRVFPVRRIV
jgi:DNA-directed RNA polymerase specialized sigma24 family protein